MTARNGAAELARLVEALELHLADALEGQMRCAAHRLHDRVRYEHLAAAGARHHPRGQVDLAPEVVAVAVERRAPVDADARLGPLVEQAHEPDRPVDQRLHVVADHHHLVADRLDHPGVVRQRVRNALHEALDQRQRLLLALLLGEARIAGEVRERDRHPHPPALDLALLELVLHVADHVLRHEVLEKATVHVVHQRRRDRQQVARQALHLLRHLQSGHSLAHQRLVHVQVEQAHLGVGDLGQRLPVDPAELEERDQREAGLEHRRDVAQRLEVLVRDGIERRGGQADAGPEALDQRLLEAGLVGRVGEGAPRLLVVAEERLDVAVGQPALPARLADVLEPVPARPQPRDDAGVRHGGRRPLAAAVHLRDHAAVGPATKRRRRDAYALGCFRQGEGLLCHGPEIVQRRRVGHSAAACGRRPAP